jgi:hypothetical protein
MQKEKAVLRAFLIEKMAEAEIAVDESILQAVQSIVTLEEGDSNEAEETRSIHIKEATDGTFSATSIKLYNIVRISKSDLLETLGNAALGIIGEDKQWKVALAILLALKQIYKNLTHTFNALDAKILLSILQVTYEGKKAFSIADITEKYIVLFGEAIPDTQVARSIKSFKAINTVKNAGYTDSLYKISERFVYERD